MESTYRSKISIRKPAPEFSGDVVIDGNFKKVSLLDFRGKWVVLFFWPLDFTFVCPTEICNFSDAVDSFREINTEIIGCSVDSKFAHKEWSEKPRKQGGLAPCKLPLLSDLTHQISKDYGVYLDHSEDQGVALRGTFIIDPVGNLRQYSVNDLPVGRNVDEVLRLVQAFQFNEKYGEVCPAKWKPGGKTMVTDHNSSKTKEFFESSQK